MTGTALTDSDRQVIANARQVMALKDSAAVRRHAGAASADVAETFAAYLSVLATAQWLLGDLVAIAERLAGQDGSQEGDEDGTA